ncbi:hypothetical protein [Endozoicomonas lisbonensis]|uniref:Uncharacterized protein n=1 Tax=Endozoicomonas lisbonensis TaxID=3120522 RepID=A0ABV2SMW3_9GAMM
MVQFKILGLILCLIALLTPLICKAAPKTRTYKITTKDGSSRKIKVEEECLTGKEGQKNADDVIYVSDGATMHRFTVAPSPVDTDNPIQSRKVITRHLTPPANKWKKKRKIYVDGESACTFIQDESRSYQRYNLSGLWRGTPLLNSQHLQALTSNFERVNNRNILLPIGTFEVNNTIVHSRLSVLSVVTNEDGTITLTGEILYSTRQDSYRNQGIQYETSNYYSDPEVGNSLYSNMDRRLYEIHQDIRAIKSNLDEIYPPGTYNIELSASAEASLSYTSDGGVSLSRLEVTGATLEGQRPTPIDGLVVTLMPEQNDIGQVNNTSQADEDNKLSEATGVSQCYSCCGLSFWK